MDGNKAVNVYDFYCMTGATENMSAANCFHIPVYDDIKCLKMIINWQTIDEKHSIESTWQ